MGIIGKYISFMFQEIKNRPIYIIDEIAISSFWWDQPRMKLSLTNRPCSLFEWRIPSRFINETSSDLNLKN